MKIRLRLLAFIVVPCFLIGHAPFAQASAEGYKKASKYMPAKKHGKKITKKDSHHHSQKRKVASNKHKKNKRHKAKHKKHTD